MTYIDADVLATMTLGDRIREYRERRRLTQDGLAAEVGVSRQTISNWENDTYTPKGRDVAPLAKALGVSVSQLYDEQPNQGSAGTSGRSEAYLGSQRDELFNVRGRIDERRDEDARRLPIYRWGSLGDPRDRMSSPSPDREDYPPAGRGSLIGPNGFGVDVRGESMVGRGIQDGDVVWVNPDRPYKLGGIVLALVDDGSGESGMVVKTYGHTDIGEGLISERADGREPVVCREYRIIGPVVWIERGFPPR